MIIDIKEDRSKRIKYDYLDFPISIRSGLLSVSPDYNPDGRWHGDIELKNAVQCKQKNNYA